MTVRTSAASSSQREWTHGAVIEELIRVLTLVGHNAHNLLRVSKSSKLKSEADSPMFTGDDFTVTSVTGPFQSCYDPVHLKVILQWLDFHRYVCKSVFVVKKFFFLSVIFIGFRLKSSKTNEGSRSLCFSAFCAIRNCFGSLPIFEFSKNVRS